MKRVLFLSSWSLFKGEKISVPFIYEQIGSLSGEVRATYLECSFTSVIKWIALFFSGKWIENNRSNHWKNQGIQVECFIIFLPKFSTSITKNSLWKDFYWAGILIANSLVKRIGKIDIIHLHTILPVGGFAMGIKRRLKVPFLLQEHSAPFEMHCDTDKNIQGVRKVCKEADLILPVGEDLKIRMCNYFPFPEKYFVTPNWVRTDIFKPEIGKKRLSIRLNILTVCSAQKQKRHDRFLLLLKEMLKHGLDIHGSIIGFGKSSDRVNKLIETLDLQAHVTLYDKMEKRELLDFYRQADVYICTSDRETFGIAPAEAIACGIPVLTTSCGGPEAYVNSDNGEVSDNMSVNSMFDGFLKILSKLDHYEPAKMWESIHIQFGEEIYKKIIQSKYDTIR